MTFSPHLHGQELGSLSQVGSECWSASWDFPWVHSSTFWPSTYCMTTFLSLSIPKIYQGDLGTYILDLYGTNEFHLSWPRVRCRFRKSDLVTRMHVEHCSIGKGFLQALSLSIKGIISMWCHTSRSRSTQTLIFPVPLGSRYMVPPYHSPPHFTGQKEMDMFKGASGIYLVLTLC